MGCATMLALVACLCAASAAASSAPATPAEYTVLQERSDRLLVELPNRLLVLAQELHSAPVVTAQVQVKTGSIYEQELVGAGLSHFLEHLVSGGTTADRTEEQSNAILARIGAITNASTGLDKVQYYINATSEHAAEAIELLSDWLQHCAITEAEYERERDVIQREFEMGAGEPERIFWKLTQQARFRRHPARHPTIGYLDEFRAISRDQIDAFYHRMYVPNNMVFLVVGDIDRHAVVDQVARLWSASVPRPLPPLSFPVEPAIEEPRRLSGTASIDKPRLRLAWPGTRLGADGDYALDLLAGILGQGESSRLVRTVRDSSRAVNRISAYNLSFAWGEGFFGVDAEVAVERGADPAADAAAPDQAALERAEALILEQIRTLVAEGVTDAELARAKRQVLAENVYGNQTVEALAGRLGHGLIDMGDPDYAVHYTHRIQQLGAADLRAAAERFLGDRRLITITLMPAPQGSRPEALRRPQDDAASGGAAAESIVLDNSTVVERLRATVSGAGAQVEPIVADPVQRWVLPNGLRVLLGRSTLVPAVAVQLYQSGGLLADQPGAEGLSNCVAEMRTRGTATRSAESIAREVEDLGATLATHCGNNTAFTEALCLEEDLAAVLELFADVVLRPSFPDEQWQKMQPRLLAAIDRQTDTWSGELGKHFRQAYYGEHPWSQTPLGRRALVAALTAQDLRRAHQAKLAAADSVLAVFGDFEPDQAIERVRALFAEMPPAAAGRPFSPPLPAEPKPLLSQQTTAKPVAAVQIGFGPGVTRSSADYPALAVLARLLSRFPTGWLDRQLRGEAGLAYVVACFQSTGLVPGYMAILFNAEPAKVPEALRRTALVVRRARIEPIDDQDLAAAKAAVLTAEFFGRQANSDRAASFALNELYGLGLDEAQRFRDEVARLDAAKLAQTAATYLRNPVTVVLAPQPLEDAALEEAAAELGEPPAP